MNIFGKMYIAVCVVSIVGTIVIVADYVLAPKLEAAARSLKNRIRIKKAKFQAKDHHNVCTDECDKHEMIYITIEPATQEEFDKLINDCDAVVYYC